MFGKKFFAVIFVLILLAVSAAVMEASGTPWSTVSESATIVSSSEPVAINLAGANVDYAGDRSGNIIVQLYPGEETTFTYQITNLAQVDYVVEMHPVFNEEDATSPVNSAGWFNYQFTGVKGIQSIPSGNVAYVLVAADSVTEVTFKIGPKKDAPTDLEVSLQMLISRTDCTVPEGCLGGLG